MGPRMDTDVLKTAAKIAMIFVGIVWVFSVARDDGGEVSPIAATADEQVIEAPHERKSAISGAGGGLASLPAVILQR